MSVEAIERERARAVPAEPPTPIVWTPEPVVRIPPVVPKRSVPAVEPLRTSTVRPVLSLMRSVFRSVVPVAASERLPVEPLVRRTLAEALLASVGLAPAGVV